MMTQNMPSPQQPAPTRPITNTVLTQGPVKHTKEKRPDSNSPRTMANDSIKLGQLNLNYSKVVTAQAKQLMVTHGIDILAIQELYAAAGKIRGFGLSPRALGDMPDGSRSYAGLIYKETIVPLSLTNMSTSHITASQISIGDEDFYVLSVYIPCRQPPIEHYLHDLERIMTTLAGDKVIISMDANARSTLWHCEVTNRHPGPSRHQR